MSENKTGKYFKYAIGEIVLVVIGILIALSINNWSEGRKEQVKLKTYVSSLIEDLEKDLSMMEVIIFQNEDIISRIDSLSKYVMNKRIDDMSNLDLLYFTLNKPHRPYKWNRATLEELKSSGSLRIIKNDSLIKKIAKYDAETNHLDVDYENDKFQFEKCTELLISVVNTNYSNYDAFYDMLLPVNNRRNYNLFNSEQYEIAKEQNLNILTNDIDDINKMVNGYNVLKSYLKIRTDDELPKLIIESKLIISTLRKTYVD